MSSSGGYPLGAENDPRAPYNQKTNSPEEIDVTVCIVIHKQFKLKVTDYRIISEGKNEDGDLERDLDFSDCDLNSAFDTQHKLGLISDWNIDEFEIIKD